MAQGDRSDLPLHGVRIVEFGHVAAGPFAGMLLADLGADVVKVEPPNGDQMRAWPPIERDEDDNKFSYNFTSLNRNKRSVVADLKDPEQNAAIRRLMLEADVVVQNYRPGVLDKLGLGYEAISEDHRGVVFCSISGFGLRSPYRDRGAYDVVIQGMSGLMSVTGSDGGPPVKAGVPVADFITGLYAAMTVAALVHQVRESGTSRHVDVPMLDCLLATSALQVSEFWGTGRTPSALGSAHPRNAPYQAFRGRDRYFTVAAGNDRLWQSVATAVERPELLDDPRFTTQEGRVAHQVALAELLEESFMTRDADEWVTLLSSYGVPCGPINTFEEVLADPHVVDTGLLIRTTAPVIGEVSDLAFPARISGAESVPTRRPPLLGEHNDEVLAEWTS
ncbi:CaiB/BaiF CoA transferase family protein [Nocardioides currus]|uniref:Carnitine dehydratase n=1 Tax=Nocardioides currus TaxID=2133958 RepID=A0A2R7Z1W9_9ACTN|nr:CoA transferase [Nocardioides currus]PUA82625.1 carnitine dehydratase [Nocardioides currus]